MGTDSDQGESPGPDEVFCVECGDVIKERAEICPNCGVRQSEERHQSEPEPEPQNTTVNVQQNEDTGLTDRRQYELEKMASQGVGTVIIVSLLLTPVAYWMIGKKMLAVVNLLTLNFFFLGWLIVPIHCYISISNAREELRKAGVAGY